MVNIKNQNIEKLQKNSIEILFVKYHTLSSYNSKYQTKLKHKKRKN